MGWFEGVITDFASTCTACRWLLSVLSVWLVRLMHLVLCIANTYFVWSKSSHVLESFISLAHAFGAFVSLVLLLSLDWSFVLLGVLIVGTWPLLMELGHSSVELIAWNILLGVVQINVLKMTAIHLLLNDGRLGLWLCIVWAWSLVLQWSRSFILGISDVPHCIHWTFRFIGLERELIFIFLEACLGASLGVDLLIVQPHLLISRL